MPRKTPQIQADSPILAEGLAGLLNVNAATVNLWAKQVKNNPFAINDDEIPTQELLKRAKYLLTVADAENKAFAKDYFNTLLNKHIIIKIAPAGEEVNYEKDIAPNAELLDEFKRQKIKINNSLSLAATSKDLSYNDFSNRLTFKAELAAHIKKFRENSQSSFLASYEFLKFWEFLVKKFPDMTPDDIKKEVKNYWEDFQEDERANVATLLMVRDAYQKVILKLSYQGDLEADELEARQQILDDIKNGRDTFASLLLFKPDQENELQLAQEAGIKDDQVEIHISQTAGYIFDDLLVNTQLRRALDNELDQMELFGKNKIQRNKKHDLNIQEQGETAIELAKKLRELSQHYFLQPFKSDDIKRQFKADCNEEIKKANEVLGKVMPLQWKDIVKNVVLIVSAIATGGLTLAVKATLNKARTGKIGSLFYRGGKKGKEQLKKIQARLSSPTLREKDEIELTSSAKKPQAK